DDRIEVRGTRAPGAPAVRVLTGAGADVLDDTTDGSGITVHEGEGGSTLVVQAQGPRARVDRSARIPMSAFGYEPPQRSGRTPVVVAGYNADDGLILGGGIVLTTPGFGRNGYLRRHRIEIAGAMGGGRGRYRGEYPDAVGRVDLGLDLDAQTPMRSNSFYGYGNGSTLLSDAPTGYYRVSVASARVAPYAEQRLAGGLRLRIGPSLSYVRPDVDEARFLPVAGLPARDLRAEAFAGADARLDLDAVDDALRPTQGARFSAHVRSRLGMNDNDYAYTALSSSLSLYATHRSLSWATLALRGSGEHLAGTFPFYDAASLGGATTLRGFRNNRFAGRSAAYASAEPRVRLSRFRAQLSPYGEVGVLGFYDLGRVWGSPLDGGTGATAASGWHTGIGGGVWLMLAERATATASYGRSSEGGTVMLRLGFAW
ncbi:MAG TPA: BamA/TamA family outer membrane protein, partial [Rubricoccaceae bacterium]